MSFVLLLSFSACTNNSNNNATPSDNSHSCENKTSNDTTPSKAEENLKILVVYFSMPETIDPNNMTKEEKNSTVIIDGKVLGNTQYVASLIKENTDRRKKL